MHQHTHTEHVLEMRERHGDEWTVWHQSLAGMYAQARIHAYRGRLAEALEQAEQARIDYYGDMHGIEFRCVTKSTTITTVTPPGE